MADRALLRGARGEDARELRRLGRAHPARVKLMHGFAIGTATSAGRETGSPASSGAGSSASTGRWASARRGDAEQIEELLGLLGAGLDEGALGIGMGLDYTPARATTRSAPCSGSRGAKRAGARAHEGRHRAGRHEPDRRAARPRGGHARGAPHLPPRQQRRAESNAYLERIAAARARGLDVTTEVYPYVVSSTYLESAMFDDGWRSGSASATATSSGPPPASGSPPRASRRTASRAAW